jgi:hypothetical protein
LFLLSIFLSFPIPYSFPFSAFIPSSLSFFVSFLLSSDLSLSVFDLSTINYLLRCGAARLQRQHIRFLAQGGYVCVFLSCSPIGERGLISSHLGRNGIRVGMSVSAARLCSGGRLNLNSGSFQVEFLDGLPVLLTDVFRLFFSYVQANAGMVSLNTLRPHPSEEKNLFLLRGIRLTVRSPSTVLTVLHRSLTLFVDVFQL